MYAANVTQEDLENALRAVNRKYKGNTRFKRLESRGRRFLFTLTVETSKGAGGRLSSPDYFNGGNGKQRRIKAACWHVHGDFFDALFSIKENAVIKSRGERIDIHQGNWEDFDIGCSMYPFYHSDACMCE